MSANSVKWFATGLAMTPALDYLWHRFGGHDKKTGHSSYEAHQGHHKTAYVRSTPWDEMAENASLIALTVAQANLALAPLMGLRRSLPLSAGLAAGYVFITLYHAQMHDRPPKGKWEEWMWRFHWHHHLKSAKTNFGLTSPIFDFLLGTAEIPEEVVVPEAMKPVWLNKDAYGFKIRKKAA